MHYHLIGIGGAGMSAIAQILHDRGEIVSGSDRQENDAVRRLRKSGVRVSVGHDASNIDGADLVVYSAAIPTDNPELETARERGIETLERPAMLGRLMEPYTHRVAISGTHGKTTTTSMLSAILQHAEMDATVLIGGDLSSLGGNARLGQGGIIVTEACEAFGSFLHLRPSIAVITNIDADHLDHYGSVERIEETFRQFIDQVDPGGSVIACWDDARVRKVVQECERRVVRFGLQDSPDFIADHVDVTSPEASYTLVRRGEALGRIRLGVPGEQNVMDSLAAIAAAFELTVPLSPIQSALEEFRGAGRRFEILCNGPVMVVDDYAHHPAEIAATLRSARAAYDRRIVAVFQPHLYSRTKIFMDDFAESLSLADEVIITDIYAAREQPMEGVTAEAIVDRMRAVGHANVRYLADKAAAAEDLRGSLQPGDMAIVLGAGDIRQVSEQLAEAFKKKGRKR